MLSALPAGDTRNAASSPPMGSSRLQKNCLINPLGEWVLRKACSDAVNWPAQIRVAVNLSAVQFQGGGLVEIVSKTLTELRLPA